MLRRPDSDVPHSSPSRRPLTRSAAPFPALDELIEGDAREDDYAPHFDRYAARQQAPREYSQREKAQRGYAPVASYPDDVPSLFEEEFVDEWDDATPFDELAARRRENLSLQRPRASTPRETVKQRPIREQVKERSAQEFRHKTHAPRAAKNSALKKPVSKTQSKTAARGKKKNKNFVPQANRALPRALPFEIAGVLALTAGAVLLWNTLRPHADGLLPRLAVGGLQWLFGAGASVFAAMLCLLGFILIAYRQRTNFRAFGRGMGAAFLVFLTAAHLSSPRGLEFSHEVLTSRGGFLGGVLAFVLRRALGEIGATVALVAFALIALLLFTETSLADTAHGLGNFARFGIEKISGAFGFGRERALHRAARIRAAFDSEDDEYSPEDLERAAPKPPLWIRARRTPSTPGLPPNTITPFEPIEEMLAQAAREPIPEFHSRANQPAGKDAPADASTPVSSLQPPTPEEEVVNPIEALEAQARATAGSGEIEKHKPLGERIRFGDGPLMPEYFQRALMALDPPIPVERGVGEEDTARGVQHVEETLKAFKIDARVTDVKRGPVITRYEVQPAPGVRVAAIANLDRDIARSLSAYAVRIEAPVPGRNVVGIEVPNKKVHLVRMRDVLELPEFLSAQSKLAFVLGKDIAGTSKWADLTKMPHLLIAGATNSGKSVCLNSVIASILLRASPDEVKFSLIDPKRVELTLFRDIPHLYHPVVVEPKDAVRALRGSIAEMDRRYKRFAERGVRNIASYNSKLEEGEAPLPYIVIVIDELADLMMTAAAEFEKLICRIAQLARATGIHLIVATQRPSVNVITGVIKANIPARIAFAVASQVDSRTILDSVGAERLIGSGDMLFDSNTGGKAVRIQGAYLSEEEVNRVVEVVKETYAPVKDQFEYGLDLSAIDTDDSSVNGDDDAPIEKRDELYDEIKAFSARYDEMSASMIQRKFEIGYPRAGRIVDQLERDGVLGPADGPKPRKVLGAGRN